jgi:hypothetical protein
MKTINPKTPVPETKARALTRALAYMMADRYIEGRRSERQSSGGHKALSRCCLTVALHRAAAADPAPSDRRDVVPPSEPPLLVRSRSREATGENCETPELLELKGFNLRSP